MNCLTIKKGPSCKRFCDQMISLNNLNSSFEKRLICYKSYKVRPYLYSGEICEAKYKYDKQPLRMFQCLKGYGVIKTQYIGCRAFYDKDIKNQYKCLRGWLPGFYKSPAKYDLGVCILEFASRNMNKTEGFEPDNPKFKERYWVVHARESYRNRHLYNMTEALRHYNATSVSIQNFFSCVKNNATIPIEKEQCDYIFPMSKQNVLNLSDTDRALNKRAVERRYKCYWNHFQISQDHEYCKRQSNSLQLYTNCL